MDVIQELIDTAGLNENEATVYTELLQHDALSAHEVSRATGIERTLTYSVLNNLIDQGLVSYTETSEKRVYDAAPPQTLVDQAAAYKDKINDLANTLDDLRQTTYEKVTSKVLEGRNAIRTMFNHAEDANEFLTVGATQKTHSSLYEMPHIVDRFKQEGIDARVIIKDGHQDPFQEHSEHFEYRVLNGLGPCTYNVFDDYVATVLLDDKRRVILTKSSNHAETQRAVFEHLWEQARQMV